jgi:6-phosphogluconate dehydrogenase
MNKELVFIGLGRMGKAMTEHLVEEGYKVHGFDVSEEARVSASKVGVTTYNSIPESIQAMEGRKVVWVMVPSKYVDDALTEIYPELKADDIVIDGGNTFFKETLRRAEEAKEKNIHYLDCGTSGGVTGARNGASLMVGGGRETVTEIEHVFIALAAKNGYGHVGKSGAGHFVKMVHNGIEYGMIGAIAEGMNFLEENEEKLGINTKNALNPYVHESIITSKLMTWMSDAYNTEGYLEGIAGDVPQGETEFEMEFIADHNMSPVLEAALNQRKATRGKPSRIGTLISAMRNQFGGHATNKKD